MLDVGYCYLMILWGFSGIGKIILVELIVYYINVIVLWILVVISGVKDICVVMDVVEENVCYN